MTVIEKAQKYYKGNLSFFDDAQEQYKHLGSVLDKEKRLMEICPFGDEINDSNGENVFAVLDDVNTLKNVMVFAEINRYRETLLADMPEDERRKVTRLIINNLDKFHVKPVAFEVKEDAIVVAWYLNSVINTFRFSENIEALVD